MPASLAEEMVGRRILVTTESWFIGPDGRQYRAVVGRLRGIRSAPAVLGMKVNARSVDWYAEIGRAVIAGCQIHYVIGVTDDEPNLDRAHDFQTGQDGVFRDGERPCVIFNAGD